jgi:hypothetical protein
MARATNPGAPQRVSAHVVPKAPSFSNDDEEEKTTIESGGWEEEASTTVEQGEVADKVRALAIGAAQAARSNTAITSTTGSGVSDEPTVDDQRASAALALLPPPSAARLVITQGNDAGRQLDVRPGKTYTVGRGIDNDLVLTDITASRKHFEIRHENGAWILADRASGNGTLINSRIEDAPFMLATGDTIEVGHTAFRFEVVPTAISLPGLPYEAPGGVRTAPAGSARDARAAGVPTVEDPSDSRELMPTPAVHAPRVSRELISPAVLREAAVAATREAPELRETGGERARGGVPDEMPSFDGSVDDDLELSTVSGKPMHAAEPSTLHAAAGRPKTLPPPAPLPRPRTQTGRPPLAFAATRSQQMAVAQPTQPALPPGAIAAAMAPTISPMHAVPALPQPATTLPLPQMANRPPLAPGLLDSSLGSSLPQLNLGPSPPATLPGQGPPLPPNRAARLPFAYPSAPELAPQRSSGILRAPVNVAAAHLGRDATSTAQVQPMSYSGGQAVAAQPPAQRMVPALSRRMMLALGLVAIAVFAAITTIAILRSGADTASSPGHGGAPAAPASAVSPAARPPTVTPIPSSSGVAGARPATDKVPAPPSAPRSSGDKVAAAAPGASASSPSPATAAPAGSSPAPALPAGATASPAPSAPAPPPGAGSPNAQVSAAQARVASADRSPSPSGPSAPGARPPASSPPTAGAGPAAPSSSAAGSVASDRVAATGPSAAAASPPVPATAPAPAAAGPEPAHAASDKARADAASAKTARPVKRAEPRRPEHKVEVAVAPPARSEKRHGGRSLQDVKSEATGLYRSKNFSGAALAINSSLSGFSSDDVKDLKAIAAIYSQLGKAYAVGMAPGTKPIDAYQALLRANDYDREVGGSYAQELRDKLVAIAPRAATSYMAAKSFEQAFQAVRKAEELGSRTDDLKIVRQNLEDKAKELLRAARSELASDPEAAKQKLRQIQGMVERQNPLWQQAARLLNGP